jgi:hypothetical protein
MGAYINNVHFAEPLSLPLHFIGKNRNDAIFWELHDQWWKLFQR